MGHALQNSTPGTPVGLALIEHFVVASPILLKSKVFPDEINMTFCQNEGQREARFMKKKTIPLVLLLVPLLGTLMLDQTYSQRAQRTGEITRIDVESRSFVVKTARGETNILTTESTVFKKGDEEIRFEDLKVGDPLQVIGVRKEGANVEAREVTIRSEEEEPSGNMM